MKHFFIFSGALGAVLLVGIVAVLFIGVPSNQKEIVKVIDVRK